MCNKRLLAGCLLLLPVLLQAQNTMDQSSTAATTYELNTAWKCQAIGNVHASPEKLSIPGFSTAGWLPATVPGTVLTTLINNHLVPDPFYGLNNKTIPDIYTTGRDHYTYWFVRDFKQVALRGQEVWLDLRGVNYSCDIWLNGHRVTARTHQGMYLRQSYNITALLAPGGENRLAVIVYPPDPVGNPNGGQGGDGEIARNVAHQYVAGWDWIQPIPDRNTGIWDKVTITITGSVRIRNPHVVTEVPGARYPDDVRQAPAYIHISAELENVTGSSVRGRLYYLLDGREIET